MESVEAVFNHLVLPPKLPDRQDKNVRAIEEEILSQVFQACRDLRLRADEKIVIALDELLHSLNVCADINQDRLNIAQLLNELRSLRPEHMLIVYIVEQNAALLIHRNDSLEAPAIIFEAFEASPPTENVLESQGTLQWDFPARAVQVPVHVYDDDSFLQTLADFLEKASIENIPCFSAQAQKGGTSVTEVRNTTSPILITEMLMALLEGLGSASSVSLLRKSVRDDVSIRNAEMPWRRLPFWLVLRVALQRRLIMTLGQQTGQSCYKLLIAQMLANLLQNAAGQISPDLTMLLRAKLCRRLAKLEKHTEHPSTNTLLDSVAPAVKDMVENVTRRMTLAWDAWKRARTRRIPILPLRASDQDLSLSLPNSCQYLEDVLLRSKAPHFTFVAHTTFTTYSGTQQVKNFVQHQFEMAGWEASIPKLKMTSGPNKADTENSCDRVAKTILHRLYVRGDTSHSDPEHMSSFILNIFDLWVNMDQLAVMACPLLGKYRPAFPPELLDALQLAAYPDMKRLQQIQEYLHDRHQNAEFNTKTIFSSVDERCFAVKYVEQCGRMRDLQKRIEDGSEKSRTRKHAEWQRECDQYDQHSKKITEGTCVCKFDDSGKRDVRGCKRCWHWRQRRKMKICVHEDFLPEDYVRRANVVFELDIPGFLVAYRNATWRIFCDLAYPSKPSSRKKPQVLLKNYSQLQKFFKGADTGVTLASIPKSFLDSHYQEVKMKVAESEVLLPLALRFNYYDNTSGMWLHELNKPLTLQHLCGVHIPQCLQQTMMSEQEHPPPVLQAPSSYEAVASQTKCPSSTSVHEFWAYQSLLSGSNRRWLTILRELGSSNINFSSIDTQLLFSHLANQAGPMKFNDDLREVHVFFRDAKFCERLLDQIEVRLQNITSNWREVHFMELLITLSLRVYSLTSGPIQLHAEKLLKTAREATAQWIARLRDEVRTATTSDVAERASRYGFWAAILCRRTFSFFLHSDRAMTMEELSYYAQASLAVQENLVIDPEKLPSSMKNLLARDLKLAYHMRIKVQRAIQESCQGLEAAINKAWSDPENLQERIFSAWESPSASQSWVVSKMQPKVQGWITCQEVCYNYVEGHLLIDGKPSGRLPQEIRDAEATKTLFGSQAHLLAYPSAMSGMTHVLASRIHGQEVHFGVRDGETIIVTFSREGLFRFIPRHIFIGKEHWDLPSSLVHDCVHWINLDTGFLTIRRYPMIWKSRLRDWVIDIPRRRAFRGGSVLVNPLSLLFKHAAKAFEHFEEPHHLTIFQPQRGRMTVEIKRLQLTFSVNQSGRLQSRELGAVMDRNQDAGTLYGLESKIVICDVHNPDRRSIIVPLGKPTHQRRGMHVGVRLKGADKYGKFDIDSILGRLSTSTEPVLEYTKAMLHALTSFVLPDTLTRRTGSEEAMNILTSGASQPWAPLSPVAKGILSTIRALSPQRNYYPEDKKSLQTITWDHSLTPAIQHEAYDPLVRAIFQRSEQLRKFSPTVTVIECNNQSDPHLQQRALCRQVAYQRAKFGRDWVDNVENLEYNSRSYAFEHLHNADNVFQVVKLIRGQPLQMHIRKPLEKILESWNLFCGFLGDTSWSPSSLQDGLNSTIKEQWGTLVNFARLKNHDQLYEVMFFFCLVSFAQNADMDMVQFLVACFCVQELRDLCPPQHTSFQEFKMDERPTTKRIVSLIRPSYPKFTPRSNKPRKQRDADKIAHENDCDDDAERISALAQLHWPNMEAFSNAFVSDYLDKAKVIDIIMPEWCRLQRNGELSEYVRKAQETSNAYCMMGVKNIRCRPPNLAEKWVAFGGNVISAVFKNLRAEQLPSIEEYGVQAGSGTRSSKISITIPKRPPSDQSGACVPKKNSPRTTIELRKILDGFSAHPSSLRQKYAQDLKQSLEALQTNAKTSKPNMPVPNSVTQNITDVKREIDNQLKCLHNAMLGTSKHLNWLSLGGLMPFSTPVELLALLQSSACIEVGPGFKAAIVKYGVHITRLQHLSRIRDAQLKWNEPRVQEELLNQGYQNWDPLNFPDWLLLQIECNIFIRPEQIDVANAIISPESGYNSLFQLNMGRGKTSCILPMAAAVLADKKRLLRLIVPKALLLQTAQTLQSRLGSLCGRDVIHIPFSRRTSTTPEMLDLYSQIHYTEKDRSGILLTAPEHLLSFKLSGLQRLVDCKLDEARSMIKFQEWLNNTCRDVLDESDFTLSVKTQLIYPSGPQMPLDGHPHRWLVVEELLSIFEDHLESLEKSYPGSIEVVKRATGFPMVHFVRPDPEQALHQIIINEISNGRTTFFRFAKSPSNAQRDLVKQILSDQKLDLNSLKRVSKLFMDHEAAYNGLLVARGLLRNRVLLLCLKKRWNVQYGLHHKRDPIAVPFEARGLPSEQAEFGHPDVAVIFTLLAFYYAGLQCDQFRESLQRVLKSDDPSGEYDGFIQGSSALPVNLYHWNLINMEDEMQINELWMHLRFTRNVVNHYVNNFVFPLYAKQFGVKLQASAWDIPLYHGDPDGSPPQTTGFSGTNDNKVMLPLTIRQNELSGLQQTNAEVLTYLLEDRNRAYEIAERNGKRLCEIDLLSRMEYKRIRILIDAGAYILEMENIDVVKKWLEIDTQAKAGLYFDKNNRAMILYRGRREPIPLVATPFAEDLQECVVYLDEAHTRGVDLKLPPNATGALTLGPGQTKDHTVQAAMRLRALGTSQRIVFFAPPEVHQSIVDVCKLSPHAHVDSANVIHWLLEQTCCANEHLHDLYLAQGFDFCQRANAKLQNINMFSNKSQRESYLQVLQRPERRTLEELYGDIGNEASGGGDQMMFHGLKDIFQELESQKLGATPGVGICSSALEEVEQEREVEFQVEEVRQIQKPVHLKAHKFPGVHEHINNFLASGVLPQSDCYEHVFGAVSRTEIGKKYKACPSTSRLFVSTEFMRTAVIGKRDIIDSFTRPVEFVLWSCKTETALIVIPEEAEALIPLLRGPEKVATHLIIYASPITKHMLHFNQLSYYSLPSLPSGYVFPDWLKVELGIFAGRLYLDFSECTNLRNYLCIEPENERFSEAWNNQDRMDLHVCDPAHFLLDWLSLRRKGTDITHTPMGYICQNRPLHAEHAFFTMPQQTLQLFPSESGVEMQNDDGSEDGNTDIEDDVEGIEIGHGVCELPLAENEEADSQTESTDLWEKSHGEDGIDVEDLREKGTDPAVSEGAP